MNIDVPGPGSYIKPIENKNKYIKMNKTYKFNKEKKPFELSPDYYVK